MLKQVVKEIDLEQIIAPLFSGAHFNKMNDANRVGGGVGGGMGDSIGGNMNTPFATPNYGSPLKPINSGFKIQPLDYGQKGRLGKDSLFSSGINLPHTGVQLSIHEDENGCFSHFKKIGSRKDAGYLGDKLDSYRTAMADLNADILNLKKYKK